MCVSLPLSLFLYICIFICIHIHMCVYGMIPSVETSIDNVKQPSERARTKLGNTGLLMGTPLCKHFFCIELALSADEQMHLRCNSEGKMVRSEALIELNFLSAIFDLILFLETRHTIPCRAIRGSGISVIKHPR